MGLQLPPGTKLDRYRQQLAKRTTAYRAAFGGEAGKEVLRDLAPYCHAMSPCNSEREQGRRDVWLRIAQHTLIDDHELTVLFAKLTPEQRYQLFAPGPTFLEE